MPEKQTTDSSTTEGTKVGGNTNRVINGLLVAAIIAVIGSMLIPTLRTRKRVSNVTRTMILVKQVLCACFAYAEDHGTGYPPHLSSLSSEDFSDELRHYVDPDSKRHFDWLYFTPPQEIPPDQAICVVAPGLFSSKDGVPNSPATVFSRVVGFADGHVAVIPESDYQKRIAQHPLSPPCQAQKAPGSRKNGSEG